MHMHCMCVCGEKKSRARAGHSASDSMSATYLAAAAQRASDSMSDTAAAAQRAVDAGNSPKPADSPAPKRAALREPREPLRERVAAGSLVELTDTLLGEGATSQVWLGHFGPQRLEVAAKVVSKAGLGKDEIKWFREEIAIHKKLRHPNICMLHGAFEDLKKFTMVLSLCRGGSLCDTMGRALVSGEPLSEALVRHAFVQLLAALRHCHGLGIVHRDVKLENCCWTTREERTLQLIDFGYASTTDVHTAFSGSAHYAAPEMHAADAHGGPPFSCARADVWSAGVCLFAMLATQLPFGGEEETAEERDALRAKVMAGAWDTLPDERSDDALELVSGMLCVDPAERSTLNEVAATPWVVGAGG